MLLIRSLKRQEKNQDSRSHLSKIPNDQNIFHEFQRHILYDMITSVATIVLLSKTLPPNSDKEFLFLIKHPFMLPDDDR